MKMMEYENETNLTFDFNEVERLENELRNAIGNLDRYLVACNVKEENEIESCSDKDDFGFLTIRLLELLDDEMNKVNHNEL